MAQLIVRKLDDAVAERLRQRAREHAVSTEEEHRRILRSVLMSEPSGESFEEFLLSMPDVGLDEDFERIPQPIREVDL
jgi:plasmid stability protein